MQIEFIKRTEEEIWLVSSETNEGAKYKVTMRDEGDNTCTCPFFQHKVQECKHIKAVRERMGDIRLRAVSNT